MTWTYNIINGGSEIEIYDHTDQLKETISNDGTGFIPKNEVLQVMESAAMAEYQSNGFNNTVMNILRNAIFENIEER